MDQKTEKRVDKPFYKNAYSDVFQSPRANPKHAAHQVNGETQQTQRDIVTQNRVKSRA
ncbi:YpzG family protein [Pontibacillus salicampi]|uniref:YpzG family protein n=1 Tax=Pontibacillus salicampi TaxID=1449801 RepID=A0ABV6LI12_9BACI